MQNYYIIGKVRQAKEQQFTVKSTGEIKQFSEITIEFDAIDKNGEVTLDMEKVSFSIQELEKFKSLIGKYVAVPFRIIRAKETYVFQDETLPIITFLSSPFDVREKKVG